MLTGDTDSEPQVRSPRTHFAQRFAELYEAAGNPTLRRVAAAAEQRMRAAQGTRPGGASAQRISDWKAGRNVPARFESLLPVVLTLIDLARKAGHPLTRELAEPKEWQRLWQSATTWNPEADTESACPYPGLISYAAADHNLFFGRTRATTELTDLIRTATGPITLIGASGAGKSSLLAAGIIPALTDWETTALTPGAHPLTAFAEALTGSASIAEPTDSALAQTDSAPTPLESALAPRTNGPRRLLIIDQFEELFTTCTTEREREDFLTTLHTAATRTDDPIAVVLALRADFYAHCLNYQILQQSLEERSYLLGPMRPDELAQAISAPARAVGLELESGLEELVITELCGAGDHHGRPTYDPGALPLLSHVMAATWQQREGRRLTTNGYRRAGGVVGSVTETAEHAWSELPPSQQTAAREILLGLVVVTQDARDTRRTAQRPELLHRVADPEDATAALELLAATRLITLDADTVTLTHEIVLTAWPRLRGWIDEDRVGYLVRQRLEIDAAEWAAQERDSALLYRGTRLRSALEHADPPPVGPLAAEFLTAATISRDRAKRRTSRFKGIFALFGVVLLILGFAAYTQTRLVAQQRDDQEFNAVRLAADRSRVIDPSLAAQLYLVAHQLHPQDAGVRAELLRTQNMPLATTNPGYAKGISQLEYRSGDVMASVGFGDELRLWDISDPRRPVSLGQPVGDVGQVAFSPDGALMATHSTKTGIRIWDVRSPDAPRNLTTLPAPGDSLVKIAFAGDGRTLVTLTARRLTLWNLTDPLAPIQGPPRELYPESTSVVPRPHLAVSPDGRVLALTHSVTGDNPFIQSLQLLTVTDPTRSTVVADHLGPADTEINGLAFSPDSRTLAVAGAGTVSLALGGRNTVQFWQVTDPAAPRAIGTPLDTGTTAVNAMAYSPTGREIAISGTDGIALWNVTEPQVPSLITDQLSISRPVCSAEDVELRCAGGPRTLIFAPNGKSILVPGATGEIRTWSLPSSFLFGHAGTVSPPAIDAGGDRLLTQSSDGRITLWDIRNRQHPIQLGAYPLPRDSYQTKLSPDARTALVINARDPSASRALDLSDPAHIRQLADWPLRLRFWPGLSISPDWRTMATVTGNAAIQLWDITDRARPTAIAPEVKLEPSSNIDVSFDADNRTLLVQQQMGNAGGFELVVSRWDVSDPNHPVRRGELLREQGDRAPKRVEFTPDRRTMIMADHATIRMWDISDPARTIPLGDPIAVTTQAISSMAFTTDGKTMLVSGIEGAVQLWDFSDRSHPRRIGDPLIEPGDMSWLVDFVPDGRSAVGVGANGAIRLWDLDEQHAIDRVCAITGKYWTPELWRRYLPQLSYNPPCD